jgi:polar amino acid transport system substrate-binding protein
MTMNFKKKMFFILVAGIILSVFIGCNQEQKITNLSQLEGKQFGVPSGTIADELVLSKFPNATFLYYGTVMDAVEGVREGKVDAAAYDEPILRNVVAKTTGVTILPDMITVDDYGFAVSLDHEELKNEIDELIEELKEDGTYDEMMNRWLPKTGNPEPMPEFNLGAKNGILVLGTAAITEPFSFVDDNGVVVGFDIELAMRLAQKLEMDIEVRNMQFAEMIPALEAGEVDMIGACITISEERAERVLFSTPYYQGGIAAIVKQ